ncbi:MAG TPA: DoxX family protein [Gemmatimonadaceae bacterium]|nr:DoxX family protein [Gemmatimonadaceae bacterium]
MRQISLGLTVLRLIAGITICMHGYQKLFVYGFGGVTGAFTQMGIPVPGLTGPAVGILEFFGGIALIIGLFARPVAALLALDLLGAILFVRMKGGFFSPNGMELELNLFAAFVALAFAGAGAYSADEAIARRSGRAVP